MSFLNFRYSVNSKKYMKMTMDSGKYELIDKGLQESMNMKRILEFDENISEIFKKVFYSTSQDLKNVLKDLEEMPSGIISHFLKNWKDSVGASSLSKVLPTVLTGSIIEGAPLSRLFRSSTEVFDQLEADVMYISGCISETTYHSSFQDLHEYPGFVRIKYVADIELFVNSLTLEDIWQKEDNGDTKYLDGSVFKILHREIQPNQAKIDFNKTPHVVTIEQKLSGPSSEIVFKTKQISEPSHLESLVNFLQNLCSKVQTVYEAFVNDLAAHEELCKILRCVNTALMNSETARLSYRTMRQDLHFDDLLEMKSQIGELVDNRKNYLTDIEKNHRELANLLHFCSLICNESLDDFILDEVNSFYQDIGGSAVLQKTLQKSFENKAFYSESGLFGELGMMDEKITFSSLLGTVTTQTITQMADKVAGLQLVLKNRLESIKSINEAPEEMLSTISFDNVPCFYCPFWPDIASEWITRQREWPAQDEIEKLSRNGCFVVSKPSQEGTESNLDWRWSFSSAEIAIAHLRTPKMKYCYFIFKSLFYKYLKSDKKSSLPSYVAKTCMLNFCDQHSPEWFEKHGVSQFLIEVFQYLKQCLKERKLMNHFICKGNIIGKTSAIITDCSLQIVCKILNDPIKYFKFDKAETSLVSKLLAVSIHLPKQSLMSSRERYKQTTGYFKERAILLANNFRFKCKTDYYLLRERVKKMQMLMSIQKLSSVHGSKSSNVSLLFDKFTSANQAELDKLLSDLSLVGENGLKVLKEIGSLLKLYCIRCDVCSDLVPCGIDRYHCRNDVDKCSFDICLACFSDKKKENLHHHQLSLTNECSPHCFSKFNEECLGRTDWSELARINQFAFMENTNKIQQLILKIGFRKKRSFFNHQCSLLNKEMSALYECFGLQREFSELTPEENEEKERALETCIDNKYNYEDEIPYTKSLLVDYEKRLLIEKLVYDI